MHARDVALTVGAALVALGGVYLFLEVRDSGAKPPSAQAIEEARLRHARAGGSSTRPALARDGDPSPALLGGKGDPDRGRPPLVGRDVLGKGLPEQQRGVGPDSRGGDPDPGPELNPDLDAAMLEANKAYDRKDFETARTTALKLLQDRAPGNVRMLRVVVSSSCVLGDAEMATKYNGALPEFDRGQMASRCSQYGITLP